MKTKDAKNSQKQVLNKQQKMNQNKFFNLRVFENISEKKVNFSVFAVVSQQKKNYEKNFHRDINKTSKNFI